MGRLYALGDIHISYKANREALSELEPHPNDGLILCGDIGETSEHLEVAFRTACALFKTVFWVPGNHELYTLPRQQQANRPALRGESKYRECVEIARSYGVLTPEDPFARWTCEDGQQCVIALIFTLYDYTFRPIDVPQNEALQWAKEEGVEATDEILLHPDPFPSKPEWCWALCKQAEEKLKEASAAGLPLVIVNHWPLRQDLAQVFLVPRFSIWCGTKLTEDWHRRFNAKVVVTGHLHIRRTDWIDDTRFEECSLGYPRQWKDCRERGLTMNDLLREILPGGPPPADRQTVFRRFG